MNNEFSQLSPTLLADTLSHGQIMSIGIRPIWQPIPRIAGPAYTVYCNGNDNSMVHAAIYKAKPGDVIVVETTNNNFAVAGGNVCAVAKERGIAGFVIDGVIRDLLEIRCSAFPVFSRGVYPKPGVKKGEGELEMPIWCGGVAVNMGDIVVADEEGIVVVPKSRQNEIFQEAMFSEKIELDQSLDAWRQKHFKAIERLLSQKKSLLEDKPLVPSI